jgi:hypothetical protein
MEIKTTLHELILYLTRTSHDVKGTAKYILQKKFSTKIGEKSTVFSTTRI